MKPTSKVIKTFMVNHEWTREGGRGQDGFEAYSSEEENNYLIAHCEDGSIWKTTQDILYTEDEDWECILEAPEDETKRLVKNFVIDDLNKLDYYMQNGWELISILQQSSDIVVKKGFKKNLTIKEKAIVRKKAELHLENYNKDKGASFWEEVYKEAEAEFLAELNQTKE